MSIWEICFVGSDCICLAFWFSFAIVAFKVLGVLFRMVCWKIKVWTGPLCCHYWQHRWLWWLLLPLFLCPEKGIDCWSLMLVADYCPGFLPALPSWHYWSAPTSHFWIYICGWYSLICWVSRTLWLGSTTGYWAAFDIVPISFALANSSSVVPFGCSTLAPDSLGLGLGLGVGLGSWYVAHLVPHSANCGKPPATFEVFRCHNEVFRCHNAENVAILSFTDCGTSSRLRAIVAAAGVCSTSF